MLRYIARRLLFALVTVWVISVAAYLIIELPPGDYVSAYVAQLAYSGTVLSPDAIEALRVQYGLDQPLPVRYVRWLSSAIQGDFGMSLEQRRPVSDVIGERLLLTIVLALSAQLLTWTLAFPIGIYSAVRQYSIGDYLFTFIGFIGLAIPSFLVALVLMYLLSTVLGAGVGGLFSAEYVNAPWSLSRVWDLLQHLPLPASILALGGTAHTARVMRATLLDELHRPYVTTARSKGLKEWVLIMRHPVRVAINPFISTAGYLFPYLVSGSVIISVVLDLPTVGPLLLRALLSQDLFLAGTIVLLIGAMTVIGTLVSDLLLVWSDPRIRLE
jgi:peptide/nickel transport system permease protein